MAQDADLRGVVSELLSEGTLVADPAGFYTNVDGAGVYKLTGNPLYLWAAYLARRYLGTVGRRPFDTPVVEGLPVDHDKLPEWMGEYFETAALGLLRLARAHRSGPPPSASAIATALGFKKRVGRTGRGHPFTDFARGRKLDRITLATRVHLLIAEGHQLSYAYGHASKEYACSPRKAASAYNELKHAMGMLEALAQISLR
jgi:hypothetical protein